MNAFWGDNFHATLIEDGIYLWRCLCYVELNMVRCGVVSHPRQWEWVGYHEIMGTRRRYRLLDLERLCWRLPTGDLPELSKHLEAALAEAIARDQVKREPLWTESLAVGSAGNSAADPLPEGDRSDPDSRAVYGLAGSPRSLRAESGAEKRR
jgi:putative transposase